MVCVKRNVIKDIGVPLISVWSDEMLFEIRRTDKTDRASISRSCSKMRTRSSELSRLKEECREGDVLDGAAIRRGVLKEQEKRALVGGLR